MSTVPNAPTAEQIRAIPVVQAELEAAWIASLPADPQLRHEEGGWVYFSHAGAAFQVRRAASGGRAYLDLTHPPTLDGYLVVATYHTHPNPAAEGWETGPSVADTDSAYNLGVPCIIRAEDVVHLTGPTSRRGGLTGNLGFPN